MTHPTNSSPHDLTQRLAREADQFTSRGGTELDISQVLDRAGEIKRGRRMRATIAMAACVLAIAVPTVLITVNHDGTREPSPAPAPKVDSSPISLDGLKTGEEPEVGWMQGKVWHGPGGREYEWDQADVIAAAPVGDALLVATSDPQGQRANLVPPVSDEAQTVTSWPMEGGFAVSADGNAAAFVKPDGTPVLVQDSGGTTDTMPTIPRGSGFSAVAVTGENCNEAAAAAGCAVWVNSSGRKPEAWVSTSHGSADTPRPQLRSADDVSGSGILAGMTSANDDGSCSSAGPVDGEATWSTCRHQLGSFSPDDKHLSAFPAYYDGAGSSELAVLDAATGDVELDLHTTQDGYVRQVVWEDDEHLLAIVGEGTRAAILRIGLDGSREYAVPPTATDPYESPFVLPTR
jgi:hypothetical protein